MTSVSAPDAAVALRCHGLVKRYGPVVAVDGLDLDVTAGECFGLLGPNGAGKTTTIEILEGLLEPDAGEVEVLNARWTGDRQALRERIGIQLQETQLNEKLTVEETLRLFRSFYRDGRTVQELIDIIELDSKRTSRVGKLSGGQKQRLAVACALAGRPDVLFLDEPTTGLDPQSRRQLWAVFERFRQEGGTILMTTHYMEEATGLCDRVAIVDRGRLIALGSPSTLIASLGADHIIEFALEPASPTPSDDSLAGLPGVRDVRHEGEATLLIADRPHLSVPALLVELERASAKLARLTTHSATLEDVFVSLTGRHLRDD